MTSTPSRGPQRPPSRDRRRQERRAADRWRTAITRIELNKILVRGYPVDEIMGRVSFGEAIYLLLVGELPSPAIGRLVDAILVSSIDHGVTPPSTLAARNAASTGAAVGACVAAGVLGFGPYHGGDIEGCMRFLDSGLTMVAGGLTYEEAAARLVQSCHAAPGPPPGFGHRLHTRDPRAARLLQMALELELEGEHVRLIRVLEREFDKRADAREQPLPVNVDGVIAAICGDLGFDYEIGHAMFIISRVPGIIAQSHEERRRGRPMRQIDPKDHVYDGPKERRLPETRK